MGRGAWSAAVLVVAVMTASWQSAVALPPPVDFALQAVGEEADERRAGKWQLTVVDDGVTTLCGAVEQESATFKNDEQEVEVGPDSQGPWNLVWATLWSDEPGQYLNHMRRYWGDHTARFLLVDGEPAQCWGESTKVCVDQYARRIMMLVVVDGDNRWTIRVSRQGERVQITRDGSLFGRLVANGC